MLLLFFFSMLFVCVPFFSVLITPKASSYLASKAVLSLCRLVQNHLTDGALSLEGVSRVSSSSSNWYSNCFFTAYIACLFQCPLSLSLKFCLSSSPSVNIHKFIHFLALTIFFETNVVKEFKNISA